MLHHNPCRRFTSTRGLSIFFIVLVGICGCESLPRWSSRDDSQRQASRLQEVQLKVMRYADEYSGALVDPLGRFTSVAKSPEERLAAQNWRLTQATAAYTIASGPNPIINALDMIVLATLSRMVLEDQSVDGLYGERAIPLLNIHRELEARAWALVENVLVFEEITQLRAIIEEWRALHPRIRAVAQIRFADFAAISGNTSKQASHGPSLFSLIGLDPFGSIDPAVREIEQTRVLAERTIFYLQRAPNLLDMQIERLVYQLAVMPETKQTLTDVSRVALAAEAVGALTNDAPDIIAAERHAIIEELTQALFAEQTRLSELLVEVRAVLESGATVSESVGTTVQAVDGLVSTIHARRDAKPDSNEPRRPFDVTEYTAAMREISTSARELHALLDQVDSSSVSVEHLTGATAREIQALADHVYWQIVSIVLVLAATILTGMLMYRYAARRLASQGR
jgi:hypothetical protein